jgi:hypothetical protein
MPALLIATAILAQASSASLTCQVRFIRVPADFEVSATKAQTLSKSFLLFSGVDESTQEKLDRMLKGDKIRVQSAPTVRTLSGMEAVIKMQTSDSEAGESSQEISLTPTLKSDGTVSLRLRVKQTDGGDLEPTFSVSAKPLLELGQSAYLLSRSVRSDNMRQLITIKVDKGDDR